MAAKEQRERVREVRNTKAFHQYHIDRRLEAGVVLTGSEVKSIRQGGVQISEAFARVDKGRPMLYHAHIPEYAFSSYLNHQPHRPRTLLLHKREVRELEEFLASGGRALIPLRLYFKKGMVKVELGLGLAKDRADKRQDVRRREDEREIERATKFR